MSNPFERSFDELLNDILTDYRNQTYIDADGKEQQVDVSRGTLTFIKAVCTSSALWGLHKGMNWTADQIFPDTADEQNLYHHGSIDGVAPLPGESAAEYLVRVQEVERRPLAGGNRYDFEKWAKDVAGCTWARCYPIARGNGTVDVLIMADVDATGSEIPSSHAISGTATALSAGKLIDEAADYLAALPVRPLDVVRNVTRNTSAVVTAVDSATQLSLDSDIMAEVGDLYEIDSLCARVKMYIDDVRVVGRGDDAIEIPPPIVDLVDVTMGNLGDADPDLVEAAVSNYMSTFKPDQVLYTVQLKKLAIDLGAEDPSVTSPAGNVIPDTYHMIRPGAVNAA